MFWNIHNIKKGIILSLICLLFSGCTYLFFQPVKESIENPLLKDFIRESIYFKTTDGLTLHGWLLKPKGKSRGIILYLHGNAENIYTQTTNILWLVREDFTVFSFDYRGYGRSEGAPTIEGVHIDAEAALEKVISFSTENNDRVFILGQSIGGAIAIYTAANTKYKKNIKAVIVDSAFSSYRKIAREKASQFILTWPIQFPLSLLVNDDFSPVRWIKKVSPVPILIIHGRHDPIVPTHHSIIISEHALDPKYLWITETEGHIASFTDQETRNRLINYLQTISP